MFDMVSRKLPQETPLFMLCGELGIEYTESKMTERSRDSESYFQARFKWYTIYPDIDHKSRLRDILSNLQRQDIIEFLTDFKKIRFQEFQIHNPEWSITTYVLSVNISYMNFDIWSDISDCLIMY